MIMGYASTSNKQYIFILSIFSSTGFFSSMTFQTLVVPFLILILTNKKCITEHPAFEYTPGPFYSPLVFSIDRDFSPSFFSTLSYHNFFTSNYPGIANFLNSFN